MPTIIMLHDLPADPDNPDGLTIKEENFKRKHNIPIGTLVEVKYDTWFGNGACSKVHARLWVIDHNRDCDGTPLYTLADIEREALETVFNISFESDSHDWAINAKRWCNILTSGHSEDSLKIIEITSKIKEGYNALEWKENK